MNIKKIDPSVLRIIISFAIIIFTCGIAWATLNWRVQDALRMTSSNVIAIKQNTDDIIVLQQDIRYIRYGVDEIRVIIKENKGQK